MLIRLVQLFIGLVLCGASMSVLVGSGQGGIPWDVFHQGISERTGASIGTVVIVAGVVILLLWIPLRQRPGFGTIANVVTLGVAFDLTTPLLPKDPSLAVAAAMVVGGVLVNAFGTALYIGARMGPGPRDGLMTGIIARTGWPVRLVRTALEVSVVALGFALGGTVGVGTVVFALTVGPLIGFFARFTGADRAMARQEKLDVVAVSDAAA